LGIYIKSVVAGGAADADGRLQAGDQLLRVDGQSLIGITQERAADYLVRTGPVVTLEVAKQGAIFHGLATLLQQPSPVVQRGENKIYERVFSLIIMFMLIERVVSPVAR
jgi:afadin